MKKRSIKNTALFCAVLLLIFFLSPSSAFKLSSSENIGSDLNDDSFVTLISKSNGLETPDKEEGKTEYEIADMNHDGYLDIISVGDHGSPYVNSGQHGIMVWLGDGGDFWDVCQSGDFGYGGCGIGDLNLDGINDVAWGVHHNWNSGPFGDTIIDAALGDGTAENWTDWGDGLASNNEDWGMFATDLEDFDEDGDLDIISESFGCCNGIQIYENHLDGNWTHRWAYNGGNVRYTLETGDFNTDGHMDFICTHYDVNIYFGNGDFTFINKDAGLPVGSINAVDVGDFNHDGTDDIVLALGGSQGVRCYSYDNQSDTWISYSTGLPSSSTYYLVQYGDINGDQDLDVIMYKDPTGTIYLGDGSGSWTQDASWTMPSPGDYSAMRVDGDIDFDGREDIIIQAESSDFPTYKNILRCYSPWQEPGQLEGYIRSPHGGEMMRVDSIRMIRWISSVPDQDGQATVKIELSTQGNNGPWTMIADNLENSGSYQWNVQGPSSQTCRIRIILTTSTNNYSMISDDDFTIYNPNPTLIVDAHGPYNGTTGHPIQFTGSASGGTLPYSWLWDFGDGNASNLQNPTHSYSHQGTYRVNLTVTDTQSTMGNDSTISIIQQSNLPPQADFFYTPLLPTTADTIQFTDTSTDDGTIMTWLWDFGDGNSSTFQHPTHQYLISGDYHVELLVTDDGGKTDSISKSIIVDWYGPNADFIYSPMVINPNDVVQFTDQSYDNSGGTITTWSWEFGDGVTSSVQDPTHSYSENGSYWVNLTVMNSTGASDVVSKVITVGLVSVDLSLVEGWNLVTVPVQNGWNASDLADNISGCLSVSQWDGVNKTYVTYLPGWPDFDFPLVDGCGYFVDTDSSGVLVCSGQLIGSVSVALEVGWNLIGWYHENDTLASSIAGNISGCLSVSMWDSVNQTYNTYIPGWPDFDFIVSRGMGLFVDVDQQSMWHGEG